MRSPHLLLASANPRRLKAEVSGFLRAEALDAIEQQIRENVRDLYRLGLKHFSFATGAASGEWRQSVSRLYYGCYAVSRAIRLEVHGHYSKEADEHKKVGELPSDFPRREQFRNQLETLRDDRNLADYDHTVTEKDLVLTVSEACALANDFFDEAKKYLSGRGVAL